jgi:DNA modification methylase
VTLDLHTQGFLDALGRIDARKERGKTMKVKAEVIIGDNRQALKELPDASVQTVVTSPPYWGLRDYGTANWTGGDESCEHIKDPSKTKKFGNDEFNKNRPSREATKLPGYYYKDLCESCGAIFEDNQIGLEQSPDDFIEQLCVVFDEVWRVLKDDGTIWVNLGDSYSAMRDSKASPDSLRTGEGTRVGSAANRNPENLRKAGLKHKDLVGIPWRFAFAMQARGWYLRSDIIWHKPNPMPESVTDRPTKSHEYIFLMTKAPRYYYDHEAIKEDAIWAEEKRAGKGRLHYDGKRQGEKGTGQENFVSIVDKKNKRSVWQVNVKGYKEAHFATYPTELIEPCILAGSKEGDTVLDPFSGSGTTGEVALKHGRNYIGLELNPDYAAISEKRITDAVGMFAELEIRNATLQERKET